MSAAGRIDLIIGPMFAGKTTELMRRIQRFELQHRRCVFFTYSESHDSDTVVNLSSHDSVTHSAIPCSSLLPLFRVGLRHDVIAVDEGQFFPDVVEFCQILANSAKTVLVAGLDGTFQRKPFGTFLNLVSSCESITRLTAVCRVTGTEAPFTKRIVPGDTLQLIGGADAYSAASRAAYFNLENPGEIELVIGPVKSGKTTEIKRLLNRHKLAGRRGVLIMHRDMPGDSEPASIQTEVVDALPDAASLESYDIIGVDEGHRFDGIAEWADALANQGKKVVVAALDGDSAQKAYPRVTEMIPLCETVRKLDSVCPFTGLPAPFSVIEGTHAVPISRCALLGGCASFAGLALM